MKTTLAIVISLNGKSTKGNLSPSSWASPEDQKQFRQLISQNNLIVMGSNTYLETKKDLKHSPGKIRIVMTKFPKNFAKDTIEGQLEFTDLSPNSLIKKFSDLGFEKMLLVSGGRLNTSFFKDHLIDELILTLEPQLFGKGKELISESNLNIALNLISAKKINKAGTLLLKYQVIKKKNIK